MGVHSELLTCILCIIGQLGLWMFRASRNAAAPPMAVRFDRQLEFFAYSTRFNTQVLMKVSV